MSGNLAEFMKVLIIVVTWSTGILVGRHYMLSFDEDEREDENLSDQPEDKAVIKIVNSQNSDTMDYDGMGNYGRFPKKAEKK